MGGPNSGWRGGDGRPERKWRVDESRLTLDTHFLRKIGFFRPEVLAARGTLTLGNATINFSGGRPAGFLLMCFSYHLDGGAVFIGPRSSTDPPDARPVDPQHQAGRRNS